MKTLKHCRPLLAISATALLLGVLSIPARAHSDVDGEFRGGYYADTEKGFVGAGLLVGMAPTWDFNPNLEYVFVDDGTYFTINADVHKDLNNGGNGPAVWLGAGPALVLRNPDAPGASSQTDIGLNMFGGLGAKYGAVRPFGQFKYMLSDTNEASLAFGLRF